MNKAAFSEGYTALEKKIAKEFEGCPNLNIAKVFAVSRKTEEYIIAIIRRDSRAIYFEASENGIINTMKHGPNRSSLSFIPYSSIAEIYAELSQGN